MDNFQLNKLSIALKSVLVTSAGLITFNLNAAEEANKSDEAEEETTVVITGSRIRRSGFDNDEPIEIIIADDAQYAGIESVGELLRQSTVSSGSPQVTSASSTAFVQNGGTGSNTLSLRGLGANRTLVLLNGRRAGPAGTRGGVSSFDLNVIPLSAVERIEILKDGASSLYGSDAVAGVVNIITKNEDAANLDAFVSAPIEGGGEQVRLSGTWGKTFDKGSLMVAVDYSQESQLQQGDRDFFACGERYAFDTTTGERADAIDPRTGKPQCTDLLWGHVWVYDYQGAGGNVPGGRPYLAQYDYDGDLGNYIPGYAVDPSNPDFMVTPPGWFPVYYDVLSDGLTNADHPFQDLTSLIPETEKFTVYAQGDYELGDNMTAYGEFLINRRTTAADGYRQFWGYIYNGNQPQWGVGNSLHADWTGAQWFSPTPITDEGSDAEITVDYARIVAGLTGDIGTTSWYYDVSVQLSRSEGEYRNDFIYNDRITDQNWLYGSCVGMTHADGTACQDIPWLDPQFLAGNISQDMRSYLFGSQVGKTVYEQRSIEAFGSGEAFELPAGTVDVAIGFHYRTDEINDVPGAATLSGNTWGSTSAGITRGENTTKAVFGEAIVPVLESVELKLSARYTDVSSFGSDTTYKAGLTWDVADDVRVRGSIGTSFRSPALFELYLANQSSFVTQRSIDPCISWGTALSNGNISQRTADNCAADGLADDFLGGAISATVFQGGGFGVLEAETSESKTVGIIWTPTFGNDELSISLDYFDFLIEGQVTTLSAGTIVGRCYSSEFFATDPLCNQFDRDPMDNRIDTVSASFLNIASQINKGYDLAINYDMELGEGAMLRLESRHTYQSEDSAALFADTQTSTNGEFGDPRLTSTLKATVNQDDWSYNWFITYTGAVSNNRRDQGDTSTYRGRPIRYVNSSNGVLYHTFSVGKDFDNMQLVVGVANAFDTEPPRISNRYTSASSIGNAAFSSQYDWRGRRIFANVNYEF
ncbi:MAG: TonB-dependent receptor [Gammaproteobacteria bacterium]|nr:TonB-dependent receptor [Gammaproteobacteria bacterium]